MNVLLLLLIALTVMAYSHARVIRGHRGVVRGSGDVDRRLQFPFENEAVSMHSLFVLY